MSVHSGLAALMILSVIFSGHGDLNADVSCNGKGMNARIVFDKQFDGIIYSKGFYEDPFCRYVEGKAGLKIATFNIPLRGCGMQVARASKNITNIIIIQHNHLIESLEDSEVTLTCDLSLALQQISELNGLGNTQITKPSVKAWLDLKNTDSDLLRQPAIHVGDKMIMVIYIQDDHNDNDIVIKNCRGYDNLEINAGTKIIELSNKLGCPTGGNFLSIFNVSAPSDGNFIAVAHFKAFRFTDSDEVFLSCQIELCNDVCLEYCPVDQFNPYTKSAIQSERTMIKRSLSSNPPKSYEQELYDDFDSTRRLMHLTMNTLSSGVRLRRKTKILEGSDFSNLPMETVVIDEDHAFSEEEYWDPNFFEENSSHAETSIIQTAIPKEPVINTISELAKTEFPSSHTLTVVRKFKILPKSTVAPQTNTLESQECVQKIRFSVLTGFLCFIILCLLLTCVFLALYIRSEKKRSKISNYLLYCYK